MGGTQVHIHRFVFFVLISAVFAVGASAQTEKILYSFTNGSDGGSPQGGLVPDGKGNYFGTASFGGAHQSGVVFELSPKSGGDWAEQVIYSFANGIDGSFPAGSLAIDGKGNLYGIADGGFFGYGTVFELTPNSNGSWTEKLLYSFSGGQDGAWPYDEGVVLDSAGNLYGTTNGGGAYGKGCVFELIPQANGTWSEKILYSFQGQNDGLALIGTTPILDSAGNLYGVAAQGGLHDYGVVYELSPGSGGNWTGKVLYSFAAGALGAYPSGNLLLDASGNLYGVTNYTVYELVRGGNGTWTEKTLHTFAGGPDGAGAEAGMVFDKAGNLYGTTSTGGMHNGTVFELSPGTNGVWTGKILHRFASNGVDGYDPQFGSSLVVDPSGNVLGTTPWGGTSNSGVVFGIQP